jgi:hypothetical protein
MPALRTMRIFAAKMPSLFCDSSKFGAVSGWAVGPYHLEGIDLTAVAPIGVGIKQNSVVMVLQAAHSPSFAW